MSGTPELSVIVATYNRPESIVRLLGELAEQTLPKEAFEVVVVDDGSRDDMRPHCAPFARNLTLRVERKANGGAASARQRGAEIARGRLLVFVDDDMRIASEFLERHRAHHEGKPDHVVLGRMLPEAHIQTMPLFERFYAEMLARLSNDVREGREAVTGSVVYTGNVSMPRELFFQSGGFDPSFRQLEDTELGVRLAQAGATFELAEDAASVHGSDKASTEGWMERSFRDGVFATRVARKHSAEADASPYRHLGRVNMLSRPLLALALGAPDAARPVANVAMRAAEAAEAVGLARVAVAGATLVYGIQYYRGVRNEAGGVSDVLREYREFGKAIRTVTHGEGAAWAAFRADVRADHAALVRSQGKYGGRDAERRSFAKDGVENAGFQLLLGYRAMRFFRAAGHPLAAKFVSRMLRHLYGSDIHWDAELEPGVVIVHGFGIAIAPGVHVGAGSILFQHVTLGRGLDAETREAGAPRLARDVHVGIGATLIGPILVGEATKIMPGCVLRHSVPPRSIVESPAATIRSRGR